VRELRASAHHDPSPWKYSAFGVPNNKVVMVKIVRDFQSLGRVVQVLLIYSFGKAVETVKRRIEICDYFRFLFSLLIP
jgi:hypothetical protein